MINTRPSTRLKREREEQSPMTEKSFPTHDAMDVDDEMTSPQTSKSKGKKRDVHARPTVPLRSSISESSGSGNTAHAMEGLTSTAPPTATATSSGHTINALPTPAPSSPSSVGTSAAGAGHLATTSPSQFVRQFQTLDASDRLSTLQALIPHLSTQEMMAFITQVIPRFKRDFLKDLPAELAFHIIGFIDDHTTLLTASLVSKYWYQLLQDETVWQRMCQRHKFRATEGLPPIPTLSKRSKVLSTPGAIVSRSARVASSSASPHALATSSSTIIHPTVSTVDTIPSSVDDQPPPFRITTPVMFQRSRVSRDDGVSRDVAVASASSAGSSSATNRIHPVDDHDIRTIENIAQSRDEGTAFTSTVFGSTPSRSNDAAREQQPPHSDRLPPLPSMVASTSVSQLSEQGSQGPTTGRAALDSPDLNMEVAATAAGGGASAAPPNRMDTAQDQDRAGGTFTPDQALHHHTNRAHLDLDEIVNPAFTSLQTSALTGGRPGIGITTSLSSNLASSRSVSVPEPILMKSKQKQRDYGSKKGLVDTHAPGFSFKKYFQKSHLTERNWLRGGKILSVHTSTAEGVVTSISMDSKHIVIAMANTQIHVFEASKGRYLRTLSAHLLGVWAVFLVSKGGPPPPSSTETDLPTSYRADSSRRRDSDLGASDPSGPFGPKYPGSRRTGTGARYPNSDVANASYGWGQSQSLVVSGGCDRDVKVWDVETGECLHSLSGHTSTIRCLRVLDGRPVAVSGARDATVRVWNLVTGTQIHCLTGHNESVRCIEVAGHYCVSGSYDCTARVSPTLSPCRLHKQAIN